jgi:uncharacterized protein (DUF305 family)
VNVWPGLLAAAAAAALSRVAGSAGPSHEHAPGSAGDADAYRRGLESGMDAMMRDMHAAAHTGNPDIDFLAMMIPHHEGAVEMARLLLIHGHDPVTRRIAEDIIATQQVEIEGMRRRLEQLRRGSPPSLPDGFPALGGTRGVPPGR